ncbi:serum response factor-like [Pecten maximus]|uniref:serum response factor-like n=1 Tax=Pecten maximus TaxID=6579 RepID=UPI001458369D|nr:serum response factor-like [Pecten maximus]
MEKSQIKAEEEVYYPSIPAEPSGSTVYSSEPTARVNMNGSHMMNTSQSVFPTIPGGPGKTLTMEQVDPSTLEDDSDSDDGLRAMGIGIKPGKKTKGRVKIKMEFIENKLRRYTTFSKRKTGIMKKAYELSTLTGTQVMLLVASETGHVYTFATRKLQPMITSDSGKALIQTCLNSPDPPPGSQAAQVIEQRMNPTGFEETELSYAVSEEESKLDSAMKPVLAVGTLTPGMPETPGFVQSSQSQGMVLSSSPSSVPASNLLQQPVSTTTTPTTQATYPSYTTPNKAATMQLSGLPTGAVLVPPGTPLIPLQQNGQQIPSAAQQTTQTVYRIPNTNQLVTIPNNSLGQFDILSSEAGQNNGLPSITGSVSTQGVTPTTQTSSGLTPGLVMYQTPQGIVYAPTTATLQDRSVFNFPQPATSLSIPTQAEGGQQIITIPVPVSLSATSPQVLQLSAPVESSSGSITLSQPSAAKRSRK